MLQITYTIVFKDSTKKGELMSTLRAVGGILRNGTLNDLWSDPYKFSRLVRRILETGHCSIVDLDGTLAAGSYNARKKVRKILEERGAHIYSTARTAELVMSSWTHALSLYAGGFVRAAPKWHWNEEKRIYEFVRLETLSEFQDVIDPPDAIFSFGDNIYLRQEGWCNGGNLGPFVADNEYERLYLDPLYYSGIEELRWKDRARALVKKIGAQHFLASIDDPHAFGLSQANVQEQRYRLQIDTRGEDALLRKSKILHDLMKEKQGTSLEAQLEGVDESRPNSDPSKNKGTLYAMPPGARKEDMLNRGLVQSCKHAHLLTREVGVDIFGDTLTDFAQMCTAAYDSKVTGVVVGPRLVQCIEERANFAEADLTHFHNALKPTDRPGFYRYENPYQHGGMQSKAPDRTIILGSTAYPGTDGADTMLAYLEDKTLH